MEMIYRDKEPVPAARARSTESGHHYTPEKYRNYKLALCNSIKGRYAKLIGKIDPKAKLGIAMLVYRSKNTGDWDNFAKCVQDAIQDSGVIKDDKQICLGLCAKHIDKADPRIEFILFELPNDKELELDMILLAYNKIKEISNGY
jgi:Holliday junction resolvase RusA-like endonuclease